ncbi:hypothetical protein [Chromatium okenii]
MHATTAHALLGLTTPMTAAALLRIGGLTRLLQLIIRANLLP